MIGTETVTLKDGRSVLIRNSQRGDGAQLYDYLSALGASTEFILTFPGDMQTLEWFEQRIERIEQGEFYSLVGIDPESQTIVANASYRIGTRFKLAHTAELGMGVLPAWQGVGLGTKILDRSIADMRNHPEVLRLDLTVMKGNDRALAMYERAGFVIEGCKRRAVRQPDGTFGDEIVMGLWIGE